MVVLAVNELATNTVEHTDAPGEVRWWLEPDHRDPGTLVCEVRDSGHLADPLIGRIPPPSHVEGGRGLVLVNQLADLVQIHTVPGQTVIRLHFHLS
jgi:anti-sigma regulatory factor (Ser/Thr protein kinase)